MRKGNETEQHTVEGDNKDPGQIPVRSFPPKQIILFFIIFLLTCQASSPVMAKVGWQRFIGNFGLSSRPSVIFYIHIYLYIIINNHKPNNIIEIPYTLSSLYKIFTTAIFFTCYSRRSRRNSVLNFDIDQSAWASTKHSESK